MAVKDVEIVSIDAKRFSKRHEKVRNVRIDNNSSITMVTEINDKEANIDFRYTANYGGLGVIRIEGRMVYEGDAVEIAHQWGSDGNLPNKVASEIHTAVMRTCVPEAMLISRDIRLPPPFPIPVVNIQGKKKGSGGSVSSGMEVA